jgi:histidine ammonia-lyase
VVNLGGEPLHAADVEAVAMRRERLAWHGPSAPAGPVSVWVRRHCVGVGPPLPDDELRAIVVARAATLRGQPGVVGRLVALLDGPLPAIPLLGDAGGAASPTLAHLARALPLAAGDDDARAFTAGTSVTVGLGALTVVRAARVLAAAEAARELTTAVLPADTDAASVSDAPGILAAADRIVGHTNDRLAVALADDSPHHAASLVGALDAVRAALTRVCAVSERRTFRLTDGRLSGLPSFLVAGTPGVDNGLMLAQYTAASLVSELRTMAQPVGADTVPTDAHRGDVVSFGPLAARAALTAVDLAADVVAIELVCGAQAFDLRAGVGATPAARAIYAKVREHVVFWGSDRVLHPDLAAAGAAVRAGAF